MSPCRTLHCRSPGAVEPRARQRQHVERHIEAEAALDPRPEQLEHAPGAGAEIEQRADRLLDERGADRLLDRLVGDVQLADAVPFGGMPAEICLRRGRALRAHRGEPLAVARQRGVAGIEPCDQRRARVRPPRRLAQPEEGPRPFAEALDQSGLREEPQMARDPRLRLAQDVGEIRDGQLGLASSARMRSRVASPAALSAPLRAVETEGGQLWPWWA